MNQSVQISRRAWQWKSSQDQDVTNSTLRSAAKLETGGCASKHTAKKGDRDELPR
jgi:hypothetical protein